MPQPGLADFLERLQQAGELARVETPVDPDLEMAAVVRRAAEEGGPPLLFASVRGHDLPVLANLFGREGPICRALGAQTLAEAACRVAESWEHPATGGLWGLLRPGGPKGDAKALAPRSVRSAACQQVVRLGSDVDLARLPALRSLPEENARLITAGQVHSVDPASKRPAAGRYDLAVLDRNRLAVGWLAQDDHARLLAEYGRLGRRMPLAVVLGGDPANLLAAMAPAPGDVDALALAGLLRGTAVETVACRSVELAVPAEADLVLEGYVDPAGPLAEMGPLAAPLGACAGPRPAPVMHVTVLAHRPNPVFPAVVPLGTRSELVTVTRAMLRVMMPLWRAAVPGLVDLDLPESGAARHWGLASVRKTHAGQGRQAAGALWALRPAMFCKGLIVVDEAVDVRDAAQVWAAVAAHCDPGRDVFFQDGPPDPFDPAGPHDRLARRMAVDATARWPEERHGGR